MTCTQSQSEISLISSFTYIVKSIDGRMVNSSAVMVAVVLVVVEVVIVVLLVIQGRQLAHDCNTCHDT